MTMLTRGLATRAVQIDGSGVNSDPDRTEQNAVVLMRHGAAVHLQRLEEPRRGLYNVIHNIKEMCDIHVIRVIRAIDLLYGQGGLERVLCLREHP